MRLALALVLATLVAGCGGGNAPKTAAPAPTKAPTQQSAAPNPFPDDPQILARTTTQKQRRALDLLARDIARMRTASADSTAHTLKGTPATRKATSGFINHLESSTIDDLSKNRLIDHAAAAVAPTCDQCFQQLEAMRPIPAIAH